MVTHEELRKRGGHWIGAARSWIQRNFANGEHVTWGSDETLRGGITPRKIEDLAACVAIAYANLDAPQKIESERHQKELELVLAVGYLEPTKPGSELVPVAVDEIKRLRKEREDARIVLEEARVLAATIAQGVDDDIRAGSSPSTGVVWRSRREWAENVAKKVGDILAGKEVKTDRLPNLPPEANARGGA